MKHHQDQSDVLTEEFIRSQQALIGFVTGMLRSARDAEDIVQEAYIRLVQAEHKGVVDHPRAYIFRVVRNVAIDYVRRTGRADRLKAAVATQLEGSDHNATPENWLLAGEQVRHRLNAMASLPPKCRSVYAMRKFHDLSHREIADRLGVSVRTVENHIAKASQRCGAGAEINVA